MGTPFEAEDYKPNPSHSGLIEGLFVYALIWSVGGNTDVEGKLKINEYIRALTTGVSEDVSEDYVKKKIGIPLPEKGFIYDYLFSFEKKKWIQWMDTIPKFV